MNNRIKEYRKFSKEVFWVALAQLLPRAKAFITFPIITKTLGATNYGIWSQIQVTLGFFSPLALLGINTAMRRFLPGEKDRAKLRNDFWAAILLIFFIGLMLLAGLYFLSPFIISKLFKTQDALFLLRVAAVLIPLLVINQVLLEYFVTFQQSKVYSFFTAITDITTIILIISFLLNGRGLLAVILITIFTTMISSILALFIIIRQIGVCMPKFNILRTYFKLGLPLCIAGYAVWMIHSADRYAIGYFMDIRAVGIYSGIYTLSNIILAISAPIYFVLFPTISRYWESGEMEKVKECLSYSAKYFLMIGIPAAFGLSILGKQLLRALATADFVTAWFLIPTIVGGMLVYQTLSIVVYILILTKRTDIVLGMAVGAAIENLVLNIIAIPYWGLLGAAAATLITYISYAVVIYIISNRYLKFNMNYRFILKSIFSSIVMSLIIFLLHLEGLPGLLISIFVGCLIYFTILIFLKGIENKELHFFLKKA